ncbi:MAG TPA: PAS domain-containing sensor histidine kinase [Oligoflexus sp.]|uniref:PAS domain-containing sensor histidine kinase n=1 Tax=Oligoflexus sp. TaxID=1971216 RepID=UPI002D2989F7|nr:PAS domain-containing sensor histidine kinase [Oligoflexus sp.]HYX32350.1 PAS domain-containing sensor histidine kinase [Oligoflexus sp.]
MSSNLHLTQDDVVQTLLSLAEIPMLLLDPKFEVIDFSPHTLRLFPRLQKKQNLTEALHNDMSAPLFKLMDNCSRSSAPVSLSVHHESAPEQILHLTWKAQKLVTADGELRGYCLTALDQTYRDKLEDELKKSFRHIRDQKMALDESAIVAITDQKGVISYVNDTFCRISGYEREELIGHTHALLKSGFHGPDFFRDLWRTIGSGRVWKGEIRNRTKSGETYWVDTTIVPFLNEQGRPYQFVAIRFDVTEKKQIQENLEKERMRGMYAEKMASLGELAAGIAHELGNPAASINAWLDVIESQYERENLDLAMFMQTVPRVRRDAKRMRDIIQGMLTYARDGSRDPFQSEGVINILQQVSDYCSYKLRKCGVQISLDVPNPYLTLPCRITEISQMLVNFILNACDAVHELDERWIQISAVEQNGQVLFQITDSGAGIPREVADKMFLPFYTTKPVGRGTGLGLSIARSIVDNHHGTVTLDQNCPHTRFIITLPRVHPPEDKDWMPSQKEG